MMIDAVVFGALGFFVGWLLKTTLLSARCGLGTGGAIGVAAVAWCISVLVLATWLQGKRNYLMEDMMDRAIGQQQARNPSWVPPEQQPISHGGSSPLAGKAASFLAIGLFFGIRRQKQQAGSKTVSESDGGIGTSPLESAFYEAADKELKTGNTVPGLMAKSISEADGDEKKANARYLRLRVAQMMQAEMGSRKKAFLRTLGRWCGGILFLSGGAFLTLHGNTLVLNDIEQSLPHPWPVIILNGSAWGWVLIPIGAVVFLVSDHEP